MSYTLRIRALRGFRAPDNLVPDLLERFGPRPSIEPRRFADAVQIDHELIPDGEDPCIAWCERDGERVQFTLADDEVRVEPSPEWVVPIALALSREVRGFLVDTRGGQYWPASEPPKWRREVGGVPVEVEFTGDAERVEPDFTEATLVLGWKPVELRSEIVRETLEGRAGIALSEDAEGRLKISWTAHPSGRPIETVIGDDRRALFASPDLPTARWMVELAEVLGTVCTDLHGVPWVLEAGLLCPMFPAETDQPYESNVHALIAERARHAFDLEAGIQAEPEVISVAPVPWWKKLLGFAA